MHPSIKKFIFISSLTALSLSAYSQDSSRDSITNKSVTNYPDRENYLKPAAVIVPAAFILYGGLKPAIPAISSLDHRIMNKVVQKYPDFHSTAEDYLMWTPDASVYLLNAFHVKTTHNFKQHLLLDAGSIIITGGIGYGMRILSKQIDGFNENNTKFPSGHTANAFRAAEIFHQELKQENKVVSYAGYVVATGVGLLRIYGKEHYFSQVIAGAGLGILSTKLTYWIFEKIHHK